MTTNRKGAWWINAMNKTIGIYSYKLQLNETDPMEARKSIIVAERNCEISKARATIRALAKALV